MDPQFVEIAMLGYSVARGGSTKNLANVYQFYRTNAINPRVKANVEAAFQASIGAAVLAALSVDYTQTNTTIRWIDDGTDAPVSFTEVGVGAIAADRLPDHVCATVRMKSGMRGIASRGSKHYGPIGEDDTTGDCLKTTPLARFNSIAAAILLGFTDSDGNVWVPILVSRVVRTHPIFNANPTSFVWSQVVSAGANKSLGSMKRRKIKSVV